VGGRVPHVASWQRNPHALHRPTPSAVLVAVPTSPAPLRVEGAAAYVWNSLETRSTLSEIVAAVAAETGRPADQIQEPIATAVAQLESADAIVRADE
jgi:hypothetical protein